MHRSDMDHNHRRPPELRNLGWVVKVVLVSKVLVLDQVAGEVLWICVHLSLGVVALKGCAGPLGAMEEPVLPRVGRHAQGNLLLAEVVEVLSLLRGVRVQSLEQAAVEGQHARCVAVVELQTWVELCPSRQSVSLMVEAEGVGRIVLRTPLELLMEETGVLSHRLQTSRRRLVEEVL